MKDEWEFDDDDDNNFDDDEKLPASPRKRPAVALKPSSPSNSSLSSVSRSKSSTSSAQKGSLGIAQGRQIASPQSLTSSSVASLSQHSSPVASNSPQPRTRAARMKVRGERKNLNRRVRFELSGANSDASSSASTVPSTNQGYRSFAEIPTRKVNRKPKRQKIQWNLKDDNSEFGGKDNTEGTAKTKPSAPPVLRTASVDVYAIQDTVKAQRLVDELRYCCDTLRTSRKAPRQLEAVADLSLLLSNRKTRQCLLFSHHQLGVDGTDSPPLAILLELMKWVHEKTGCSVIIEGPSEGRAVAGRTRSSRHAKSEKSGLRTPIVQEGLAPSVVEAMGVVWHFLSMDCTVASETPSSSAARKLREGLLSNRDAMQGLLEMVVSDPYLDPIPGKDQTDNASSVGSLSQESGSSLSSSVTDSPLSTGSLDPTVAGRWRKRRRKMLANTSTLDAIPENAAKKSDEVEKKPDDFWSFTSESTALKHRENGSVSSGGSQASDAQAQLNKVLEKVKETVEDPNIDRHPCGIDKNEILARLPLLSLCRIVSGKFEGDDKSCIDDDIDDNPPEDDEDELSRNPLLRTNAMLADSGAIPFVARATSNSAVAIVEHLTNREPCSGCNAYLRWKFCKLTSLVDDACLLTDANRSAFSTEGFASETGGYLLINVTTALKALLEKGKLFEEKGWGEVAMAAIRSLTSLTHDNEMAARDLQASSVTLSGMRGCSSLSVIVDVLYEASKRDGDMTIFCLNTLANILESGGVWEPFAKLKVGDDKESFLKWLTRHVVFETKSFQDAVVESSFGSTEDRHSERQLDKNENEALMMAGNAFIFLACILVLASAKTSNKVQEEILSQLPGNLEATKLLFIKNTLKAFCNLYHFSVGALSLAIVAPVKKLLTELEAAYEK